VPHDRHGVSRAAYEALVRHSSDSIARCARSLPRSCSSGPIEPNFPGRLEVRPGWVATGRLSQPPGNRPVALCRGPHTCRWERCSRVDEMRPALHRLTHAGRYQMGVLPDALMSTRDLASVTEGSLGRSSP